MRPVRALVLSPPTPLWGAQLRILDFVEPLAERGVEVTLGCRPEGDFHRAWVERGYAHVDVDVPFLEGIRDPDTGRRPSLRRIAALAVDGARAAAAVAGAMPAHDVVWSFALRMHPMNAVVGRLRRIPTVVEVVDIVRPGAGRRLLQGSAALASAVIVNSRATGAALAGRGHVHVVHPGVDIDRFSPAPADPAVRADLASPGGVTVGILGRLDPMKGIHVLVEAMGLVDEDVRLVVVGDVGVRPDSYARDLERRARELLGDRARFVGRRTDIPDVLRALDIVVNASEAEPFGRSVLEAHAVARPVIGVDGGGVPEFVTDRETGVLVPAGDVDRLAEAIGTLVRDPVQRGRLGEAGRRQAEERFDIRQRFDEVASILTDVARTDVAGTDSA